MDFGTIVHLVFASDRWHTYLETKAAYPTAVVQAGKYTRKCLNRLFTGSSSHCGTSPFFGRHFKLPLLCYFYNPFTH